MKRKMTAFLTIIGCAAMMLQSAAFAARTGNVFYISAGGKQLTVEMADTTAAQDLKSLLSGDNLSITLSKSAFEEAKNTGCKKRNKK